MKCTRDTIMRAGATSGVQMGNIFYPCDIPLSDKPFGLGKIMCQTGTTLPVKLLAIQEKIEHCHKRKNACLYGYKYGRKKDSSPLCTIEGDIFAHIYFRTESKKASIQHYIVLFVAREDVWNDDNFVRILWNTIRWLSIERKRPHIHIFCYGEHSPFSTMIPTISKNIADKLRNDKDKRMYYKKDEDFCQITEIEIDRTGMRVLNFTVSSNSKDDPYHFDAS